MRANNHKQRLTSLERRVTALEDQGRPPEPFPCPCCGNSATPIALSGRWYVACSLGSCTLGGPYAETRARAIDMWNRLAYRKETA